jgi:hypothetical protein
LGKQTIVKSIDLKQIISSLFFLHLFRLKQSSENIQEVSWNTTEAVLFIRSPITLDYNRYCYVWPSDNKNAELRVHFNLMIAWVKYPVKVPSCENDEYEQRCQKISEAMYAHKLKNIFKYTSNIEEFSVNQIPERWREMIKRMLELIDQLKNKSSHDLSIKDKTFEQELEKKSKLKSEFVYWLPEAMPLSCDLTHLHRFDGIETLSEPKIIYLNRTWYK